MSTLKELRNVRLQKLQNLISLNIDPYPSESFRTDNISNVISKFESLENSTLSLCGRIISNRSHGKLVFFDVKDMTGNVQFYIKAENLVNAKYENSELNFDDLHLLDIGDFVEGTGKLVKTQRGEISVEVTKLRILVKSLRPLPEELNDKETRLRRRYIDTNVNKQVFDRFIRRAKFWEAHREFFKQNGFLEMNIPVLENIIGGGDANPFITHMDSIHQDFYLRISHELPLKRLIGGGYEKVYEIGPRFRNEGLSNEHLPEHMAMEFYWAYANWKDGMEFTKDLMNFVINKVYGDNKKFKIRGFEVDFSKGWEVLDFGEMFKKHYQINDVYNVTVEELLPVCKKYNLVKDGDLFNIQRGVDGLWKLLRKNIAGPAFLINHPIYLSPLQKPSAQNNKIVERFQPIIAGSELGNGWTELNDPVGQYERFKEQQQLRQSGDAEAQMMDIDYVEMLEYGMPPTFGYGHSERTFWFLEDVPANEGVIFPHMKYEIDEITRELYDYDFDSVRTSVIHQSQIDQALSSDYSDSAENNNLTQKLADYKGTIIPTMAECYELLEKHVLDDYQKTHSEMVAKALQAYAKKLGQDEQLWFATGLLHDIDYYEFPNEHPIKSMDWFIKWGYSFELATAVAAHGWDRTKVMPKSLLDYALIACDEMSGLLYAYSLMRPNGFEGMEVSSVKKKFKDKAFAAKINREEIMLGVNNFNTTLEEHINFLIEVFKTMKI